MKNDQSLEAAPMADHEIIDLSGLKRGQRRFIITRQRTIEVTGEGMIISRPRAPHEGAYAPNAEGSDA